MRRQKLGEWGGLSSEGRWGHCNFTSIYVTFLSWGTALLWRGGQVILHWAPELMGWKPPLLVTHQVEDVLQGPVRHEQPQHLCRHEEFGQDAKLTDGRFKASMLGAFCGEALRDADTSPEGGV